MCKGSDADFYVFSGHKIYGPTGIGVLYGKRELLKNMPPYQGGGDMIEIVSFKEETTFQEPPMRFEAGTPPIAQAVGLAAALAYVTEMGLTKSLRTKPIFLVYATQKIGSLDGVRLIGTAPNKASILSFVMLMVCIRTMWAQFWIVAALRCVRASLRTTGNGSVGADGDGARVLWPV